MNFKKAALAMTTAFAALGLAACDSAQSVTDEGQKATANQAGMRNSSIYADGCIVKGTPTNDSRYGRVGYDFKYGIITLDANADSNTATGYTVHFNTVTNPVVQQEITTAYSLLPASANCPRPVFAPAAGA